MRLGSGPDLRRAAILGASGPCAASSGLPRPSPPAVGANTDAIDVADLHRAGAVLRFGAARDGQLVLEREAGEHERFRLAAIRFWLEIEPVLSESHAQVLERLG